MAPSCSTAPDGTPQTFSSPPLKNLSLIFLPSRAPELNPAENIWQFLRQNHLSTRVFETYEEILDAACDAWNRLIDQSWRIMSIGLRNWAQNGQSF
jgi:transposase